MTSIWNMRSEERHNNSTNRIENRCALHSSAILFLGPLIRNERGEKSINSFLGKVFVFVFVLSINLICKQRSNMQLKCDLDENQVAMHFTCIPTEKKDTAEMLFYFEPVLHL